MASRSVLIKESMRMHNLFAFIGQIKNCHIYLLNFPKQNESKFSHRTRMTITFFPYKQNAFRFNLFLRNGNNLIDFVEKII